MKDLIRLAPQISLYRTDTPPPVISRNEIALPQVPSTAFGDGTHPTTRLCAGVMDFLCRVHQPYSVLDVGTGTGILARIARARGAQDIIGTDIDPEALLAAQNNFLLDSHPLEIQLSSAPPHSWGPKFNLLVANILEESLCELAESLSLALGPAGMLIVSGFTRLQVPRLRLAFSQFNLTFVNESYLGEWALLLFQKESD